MVSQIIPYPSDYANLEYCDEGTKGCIIPSMPKKQAKKARGRRELPDTERRRNRVTIQLTDRELDAVRAKAGHVASAIYVRRVLLRHLRLPEK